jgi:hypothetical protein
MNTESTIPEKTEVEFVDVTDAAQERAEIERPRQGSCQYIIHKAAKKRYVAVRPSGSLLEKLVAKTQKNVTRVPGKGQDAQQEFQYAARVREAWACMICLHAVDPSSQPEKPVAGKPIYEPSMRTDQAAEKMVKQPYEINHPDGLLNDVGARLVKWLNDGTSLDEQVEEAKNG